ncbi:hypothetical protein ARMSODRAFT_941715 [Armillaria solidipes]|uniref:Uncharacterized protein n=1 Tax=Armillaria solidipes TaxID=1076256 RepID=A0A2H3BJ61_9AGAR|nr:hypothetical protein ARMSODRAFT_941715 [Armillaria solidipes]
MSPNIFAPPLLTSAASTMVAKGNILQWFFFWTATAVTIYAQIINGSLVVNSTTEVHLAYLDTGAPPHTSSYTTIFAVHDMVFTHLIFQRVMSVASSSGVRAVTIQRRPFPGSTPFTDEELNVTLTGGSGDEERDFEIEMRGHEIASFVDIFIQTTMPEDLHLPAFGQWPVYWIL